MPAIRSTLAALAAVALAAAPLPAAAQATGDEAADADILVLAPFAVEDLPVQAGAPPHMRARSSQNIASEVDRFVRCTASSPATRAATSAIPFPRRPRRRSASATPNTSAT